MHFVVGGAFHGKKKWVINYYRITNTNFVWCNCYKEKNYFLKGPIVNSDIDTIVIEGIEQIVIELLNQEDERVLHSFQNWLQGFLTWEGCSKNHRLIIIGTDISKGVVPIDKKERLIRDEVGRCYQVLTEKAEIVSLIWYGLEQVLKSRRMNDETVY